MAVGDGEKSASDEQDQNVLGSDGKLNMEQQRDSLKHMLDVPLNKGETWYLVDSKWFKQWKKYVGYESWEADKAGIELNNPGPIDNSGLFQENSPGGLKSHLIDELDYVLLPVEAWNKLVELYGVIEGQPAIDRKVVEHGMFVKHCKVEVYLVELKLCHNNNMDDCEVRSFSRADVISHVEDVMRGIFRISPDAETRIWNKYMSNTYELISTMEQSVQDCGLYNSQVIVIEEKNSDGTWTRETPKNWTFASSPLATSPVDTTFRETSSYSSSSYSGYYNEYNARESPSSPGLCGLTNLGNTCFMNSALQCLSNCVSLTKFFVNDCYKNELNMENPLGMRGEIANAYAGLMHQMWSGRYSVISPRQFKTSVGRFAPQFSGYQQQDSQELMAFLLDGLHEDLNRIKKKPYIELKDAEGMPDNLVARDLWQAHRQRNDSIIVDFFHGQFKSTLICPDCEKVSVTFDPFCYLSLPLPIKKERYIDVVFVREDPLVLPMKYKLTVPKRGSVKDLVKALSKETTISYEKLVVADVYNHRFHKIFQLTEGLSNILDRDDIFIYERPENCEDTITVPIYLREKRSTGSYSTTLFGVPFFATIKPETTTYRDLYEAVLSKMRRFVRVSDEEKEELDEIDPKKSDDEKDNEVKEDGKVENMNETVETEDDNEASQKNESSDISMPCLFTLCTVNSYGSAEIELLKDDGEPLKLSVRSYVALDWYPKMKKKYFDQAMSEDINLHESVERKFAEKKKITLDDCIKLFLNKEKLGADDLWYCPSCKEHRQATKKFDLWSLPKILVIHLKRFSYNRFWRDKLDVKVDFPLNDLDMTKYVINKDQPPAIYDLHAVSNHFGGLGGGHYTAFCKNPNKNQWFNFDDSSVSSMQEDRVVASSAYLLCYTRRGESLQDNIHDEQRMEFDDSSTASSIESAPTPNGNGDEMT